MASIPHPTATLDDLAREPGKAELIGGRIVRLMPTGRRPNLVAGRIFRSLAEYADRTGAGEAYIDSVGFAVQPNPRPIKHRFCPASNCPSSACWPRPMPGTHSRPEKRSAASFPRLTLASAPHLRYNTRATEMATKRWARACPGFFLNEAARPTKTLS